MALPDYSDLAGLGSMLMNQDINRREKRHQRHRLRREIRQGRRQARRNRQNTELAPAGPVDPMDLSLPELEPLPGPFTPPRGDLPHPFFDPQADYILPGATSASQLPGAGQPGSTPFNIYATDISPEGYYFGLLSQLGLGGFDARSQTAQSLYGDFARGYQAAKIKNMELRFPEFMQMQNIPGLIQQLSEEQLGINRSRQRGPINWTLRG